MMYDDNNTDQERNESGTYRMNRDDLRANSSEGGSYHASNGGTSDDGGAGTYRSTQGGTGADRGTYRQEPSGQGYYSYYDNDPRYAQPERKRRPEKKKKSGFGGKLLKAACLGLVFGLCASLVMGVAGYATGGFGGSGSSAVTDGSEAEGDTGFTVKIVQTSSESVDVTDHSDVSDIVKSVMPCIVAVNTTVESTVTDWFGHSYTQEGEGAGSGVIFSEVDDETLYIVTNYHVIEDATTVAVQFIDESNASAQVMGYDESMDVAVLTVDMNELEQSTKDAIAIAVMGDSSSLEAGDSAIAIGNALGYGQSVTTGVISAVEREVSMTDGTMTVIQTSAAINPGNSGGALLNGKGEVIGINYMKYSTTDVEGMGFALPINDVIDIAKSIIDGTYTAKTTDSTAYLGITGGTLTEDVAENYNAPAGVYVSSVASGSAAERAGLRSGCIITEFNGQEISTMEELQAILAELAPGDSVTMVAYFETNGGYVSQELTTILGSRAEAEISE